jgi:hypothetical protein
LLIIFLKKIPDRQAKQADMHNVVLSSLLIIVLSTLSTFAHQDELTDFVDQRIEKFLAKRLEEAVDSFGTKVEQKLPTTRSRRNLKGYLYTSLIVLFPV